VVLNGVLGVDTANVRLSTNGYVANFVSTNAGTGIGVTVAGLALTGTAAGNYTLTQPVGLTANIGVVGVSITSGITANNKPYDGTVLATISSNNVVLNGVLGVDTANVWLSTNGYTANFVSANAGTGIGVTVAGLALTGTAAANYTLTQPAGLTANIGVVGVSITSGITANNKPYDGTVLATINSNNVVLNGVLGVDTANVRLSTNGYVANFVSTNAGTGIGVTVAGLALTGTAAANYTLTQLVGLTANIGVVGVSITSGITANNKPYDGTMAATISSNNVVLNGVLGVDTANVRLSTNGYVANFVSTNAGTGIGVTVAGLALTGTAAGNYTLTQPVGLTANIGVVGVSITSGITANNKPYDGTVLATISSNNVVLNGVLGVDTANVWLSTNGYTANFVSANAGTGIGVTVAGLALTGTAAANYTLTQPAGLTANITAKALTIMSVPSPVITSLGLTNGVVTITWNSVAGGNYRVQYINNLNDSGWNDLSPDVTATGLTASQTNVVNGVPQRFYRIKVLNPGITANNKVYDGTTAATINSNNVVLNGVLAGDTANVRLSTNGYTANFVSTNAGTGVGVTVGGLTLAGSAAGNYTLTQLVGLTANIGALGVTITSGSTANNKPYDGTTAATISSNNVVLNGVLAGDTANVRLSTNGYTANFVSANAGTGIGVTVAGLALTGTAAANYTLTQPAGLTANITAKALTIMSVPSPVITSLGLTNGVVTITWNSVAGGNYRVQYINNLNDSGWNDLSPDVTATGLTASQTNVVNGVPQRFYRIKVLNPGITANNKMYDGTTAATISSNNVVLAGVVDGDTVGLSTNGYAANFASPNVGTGIVVTVSGLALIGVSAANYTLTQPVGLTANITPATLTVTADNKSMTYGLPNPLLTASYSGFVHSDGTNVLTGAANLSTSATTNSPPGSYAITVGPGTLNAANYVFVFNGGTLTVAALPQLSGVALTGNQFIFNLPTIAGQTYQLQYKDNLTAATWTLLGGSMVGTGSSIIITNDLGASPQRFFRLVISP
jgi:hypothetical protein